jgi:hypothetical protein
VPWSNAVTLEGESWESVRARVILIVFRVTRTSGRVFVLVKNGHCIQSHFFRGVRISLFASEQVVNIQSKTFTRD